MLKKLILGIGLAAVIVILIPPKLTKKEEPQAISGLTTVLEFDKPKQIGPDFVGGVSLPKLGAKSVLVIDLKDNVNLYNIEPDQKLPIASLTKLMTAMVVADKVSRNQVVTVEKSDTEVIGSKMGLVEGEQITVSNLLKGMLIPSSNDAAVALSRFVGGTSDEFVEMMNKKAKILGLRDTNFANPVGLDNPNNYSTAQDLSVLTEEFLKYAMLSEIVGIRNTVVTSVDGNIKHELTTSNKLLLDNKDVVGVKTGYTVGALGNLIVKINHDETEILTIVLNTPNREEDTQKLIDWIFEAYKW